MTNTVLTCGIPLNTSPLSPNGYMFTIARLPSLSYFCQEVSLPEITLPEALQLSPYVSIPIAGDQIQFGKLRVQFLVDEKMANYKAIYDWIVGLGFPETNAQYTKEINSNKTSSLSEVAKSTSDASLVILGNKNTPIQEIQFVDCIPESLSSITFTSTSQDVQYLIGNCTFSYSHYKFL